MVIHWCKYMNAPAKTNEQYKPTEIEQVANCTTHGVMVIPSICGAMYLHTIAHTYSQRLIAWIYGASLILMFVISTIFHLISLLGLNWKLRLFFHLSDRGMIYMFIAANYMPWLLLQDKKLLWAEHVIWILWVGAVTGIVYTYCFHEKYKMLEIVFYLLIGICPSLALVYESENVQAFTELCLGGLFYISGIVFFKSDGHIPFAHAIWHLFVAMGTLSHYYADFRPGLKVVISYSGPGEYSTPVFKSWNQLKADYPENLYKEGKFCALYHVLPRHDFSNYCFVSEGIHFTQFLIT